MERIEIPTLQWYAAKGRQMKLPPRCPIAHCSGCPRYYESLSLLGRAGLSTEISEDEEAKFARQWASLCSVTDEEAPMVHFSRRPDSRREKFEGIVRFCPEVAFLRFGLFVSQLTKYPDELDREEMYRRLHKEGTTRDDPRWLWYGLAPHHYTECREYSLLACGLPRARAGERSHRDSIAPKLRWEVFHRDSFTCQYCGRRPPEVALSVDHRVSVSDGGGNELENLVTSCTECNGGKGRKSVPRPQKEESTQ